MAKKRAAASIREPTLHDHIRELRNRIFFLAIIFIGVSSVAYNYKELLIQFLLRPLGGEKLIYLNPGGGFSFIFTVTMYVGAAVTLPFAVYHLYRFVAPALPKGAQKHSALVLLASLTLLLIGAGFGYFYAIPGALNFLNNFAEGYINPSLTADSYLNFILAYTAGLGMLFQLPLILLFIHWVHPLKPINLLKFERYMVLIAFIAAALITPTPDALNQTIIALPIILMYQAGVIAVSISVYRLKRRTKKELRKTIKPEQQQQIAIARTPTPALPPQVTFRSATVVPVTISQPPQKLSPRRSFDIIPNKSIQPKLPPQRTRPAAQIRIPDRTIAGRPVRRTRNIDGVFNHNVVKIY